MTQWPALTQRSALSIAPECVLRCWSRLGLAVDELLPVRDTGTLLPSQCQGSPHTFLKLQSLPHIPKLHLHQRRIPLRGSYSYNPWLKISGNDCSLQKQAELLLSVLGHTQCGRTLGTFWSHQFSPQVMNPSNHVPIKKRNQKWL